MVYAKAPMNRERNRKAAQHLYLYEKDPTDWTIVEDGAWGKMKYKANKFVFNGHHLEPEREYALIYYPDPWPGEGIMVLGWGTPDDMGDIHIKDRFDFTQIPNADDTNPGAKIWLVLADDLAELDDYPEEGTFYQMVGWNPTEYLFEYELINTPSE